MAQYFEIHPDNPQLRLIHRAVDLLNEGAVIAYPTDSSYALACRIDDKKSLERIQKIRLLDDQHNFTLVCRNMAQIAKFARLANQAHRMVKSLTPGPYTFVLKATRELPKRLQHAKRKSVGIRIPDHKVALDLLENLDAPLFSTTLILPGETDALEMPWEIREQLEHHIDLVIDAGYIPYEPTTIISFLEDEPEVFRHGKGELVDFIQT
ncbi:MAG: threonylcarbamoyl-AMP synthase [Gammaproteobacteria bacterium]|nr:threonylcarbamoyl-AMP synthase [Gammaproteobacteria bacterium]